MQVDVSRRDSAVKDGIFGPRRTLYEATVTLSADAAEVAMLDAWVSGQGRERGLLFDFPMPDLAADARREFTFGEVMKKLRKSGQFTFELDAPRGSDRDALIEELVTQLRGWKAAAEQGPVDDTTTIRL